MAKVLIEETTLTAIGDAIRGKEGTTDLVPVNDMATRISAIQGGGSDIEVEPIVLTGDCSYTLGAGGPIAAAFIDLFPDKVSTKDVTNASAMFRYCKLETIPFEINLGANRSVPLSYCFTYATNLKNIPNITCNNPPSYFSIEQLFNQCNSLENLPYIYNARPEGLQYVFAACRRLRAIPEDYFDTWNFSRVKTYNYSSCSYLFDGCYSLREVPSKLFGYLDDRVITSPYNSLYYCLFRNCYSLNKAVNLPVYDLAYTGNIFSSTFSSCYMLSKVIFKTNDDGTPKIASKWKSQTIDLSSYVGYAPYPTYLTSHNSGITADKKVTDDTTYQALKNDPDWFAATLAYSKYNHDSAVETINSLPDTSASGGTNTIKFKKTSGANTDGGAVDNLTAEEIAVAAAKGWTVSFVA